MRPFLNKETFVEKSIIAHGNKYDYSLTDYVSSLQKVEIKCNTCKNLFKQLPYNHYGSKRGCPFCYRIKSRKLQQSTVVEFIESSEKIHSKKYDYLNVLYINNRTKVNIKCNKCDESFFQRPSNHLAGNGCPHCFYKNWISKPELEFLNLLKIENRQFEIRDYIVDGIKNGIVYEFLGDYWHGNPLKFRPLNINKHLNKTFNQLYQHTINRFNILKNSGYQIKYVWESDWKRHKREKSELIIKDFIGETI